MCSSDCPDCLLIIMIYLGTGGISTFSSRQAGLTPDNTWILRRYSALSPELNARNDYGGHWSIEPSHTMPLEKYLKALRELNFSAEKAPPRKIVDTDTDSQPKSPLDLDLPRHSTHSSESVRAVCNALATVYYDRVPIRNWDENDYAYLGILAVELNSGRLALDQVTWDESEKYTTKEQRCVARAVVGYMKAERARVKPLADGDLRLDLKNDHSLLAVALKLNDVKNPLAVCPCRVLLRH